MKVQEFEDIIEVIRRNYSEYHNGFHLTPEEFSELEQAIKELSELPRIIEDEIGVM